MGAMQCMHACIADGCLARCWGRCLTQRRDDVFFHGSEVGGGSGGVADSRQRQPGAPELSALVQVDSCCSPPPPPPTLPPILHRHLLHILSAPSSQCLPAAAAATTSPASTRQLQSWHNVYCCAPPARAWTAVRCVLWSRRP